MPQITPIQLDDGIIIYIEVTEDVTSPAVPLPQKGTEESGETTRGEQGRQKGFGDVFRQFPKSGDRSELVVSSFKAVETTIRAYTNHTLNAFKQVEIANVDKVTLEFGIELGGEAGVPYVTKGTAKSNLKITVQCSFPKAEMKGESQNEG